MRRLQPMRPAVTANVAVIAKMASSGQCGPQRQCDCYSGCGRVRHNSHIGCNSYIGLAAAKPMETAKPMQPTHAAALENSVNSTAPNFYLHITRASRYHCTLRHTNLSRRVSTAPHLTSPNQILSLVHLVPPAWVPGLSRSPQGEASHKNSGHNHLCCHHPIPSPARSTCMCCRNSVRYRS